MQSIPLRKQGGDAAVITLPTSAPTKRAKAKRHTLTQLLEGATRKTIKALNDETAWSREGDAVGCELA